MPHAGFRIGTQFRCADRVFRCTDVGTRTIVAIRIDAVETRSLHGTPRFLTRREAEDEGWFRGPPYAVAEIVFDECDLEACAPA